MDPNFALKSPVIMICRFWLGLLLMMVCMYWKKRSTSRLFVVVCGGACSVSKSKWMCGVSMLASMCWLEHECTYKCVRCSMSLVGS